MLRKTILVILMLMMLSLIAHFTQPTQAASTYSASFGYDTGQGCPTHTNFVVNYSLGGTTADYTNGGDWDYTGIVVYDGSSLPIAAYWDLNPVGGTKDSLFAFGKFHLSNTLNTMTTRPLTILFYDITTAPAGTNALERYNNILAQNAPIVHTFVADPANYAADCASLPYINTPPPSTTTPAFDVPHQGLVKISVNQSQSVYDAPAGSVIRNADGSELWLPNDADNNGSDTYIVTESIEVDGAVWLGIFLGNDQWGYVPLSGVTPISFN